MPERCSYCIDGTFFPFRSLFLFVFQQDSHCGILFLLRAARTCSLKFCSGRNLCACAHGLHVQNVKYFLFFQIKSFKIVFLLLLFYVVNSIYNFTGILCGAHAHGFVPEWFLKMSVRAVLVMRGCFLQGLRLL